MTADISPAPPDAVKKRQLRGGTARLERAAAKRRKFLLAGMRCIRKLGLRKSTMDEIAAEAGVARITLYREFGTRKALIEALIAYRSEAFNNRFVERSRHIMDLLPKLELFLLASVEAARRSSVTREIVRGPANFAEPGTELHRICEDLWGPILKRARDAGELPAQIDTARAVEWILLIQAFFSRMASNSDRSVTDFQEMARVYVLPAFSPAMANSPPVFPAKSQRRAPTPAKAPDRR